MGIATEIARLVTHSALDFFAAAEAKNLIDLHRIVLYVERALYHEDEKIRAKPGDFEVVFFNKTLHTFFSHAELYLNEKLIFHSKTCYLHSAFVESIRKLESIK